MLFHRLQGNCKKMKFGLIFNFQKALGEMFVAKHLPLMSSYRPEIKIISATSIAYIYSFLNKDISKH